MRGSSAGCTGSVSTRSASRRCAVDCNSNMSHNTSFIVFVLMTFTLSPTSAQQRANPLSTKSALPFHAPEFDKIRDADFQPAIEAGIAEQRAEILKIADNPAAPTFENTIEALERSGQGLTRAQ